MDRERDPDAPTPPEAYLADHPDQAAKWTAALAPLSPPHDGLLLPLIHDLIEPYLHRAAQHGPTPPLRTDEWLDAHPDQQLAHLLMCGVAYVLADPHATAKALLKQVACDVSQAVRDRGPSLDPLSPLQRWKLLAARADERAEAWRRQADAERRARIATERRAS